MAGYASVKRFEIDEEKVEESTGGRKFLYIAACAANLAAFTCGIAFGWTSPVSPKLENASIENPLPTPITSEESSWIGSLLPVGAAIGPWVAGAAADRIGRKNTLLASIVPIICAFAMCAYATSIYIFYLARFLCGLTVGGVFTVLPMYIGEIALDEVRGALGSFMQLFIVLGLLFSFCIGPYIDIMSFNLYSMVPPLIFFCYFYVSIPETPHFYLANDDVRSAEKSLMKLRMKTRAEVQNELLSIKMNVEESMKHKASFAEIFKTPGLRKAFILSVGLVSLQQLSGINIILFYTQPIFDASESKIPSDISTIIIGVVQVVASVLTPLVVDRQGKRFLLLISALMMGVSQAVLGTYFYLKDSEVDLSAVFWLPVVSLITYITFYCIGFGPLPWAVMGELFPADVKSVASTVTASGCWVLAFFLTKFFSTIAEIIGMGITFWLFSGFCMFAIGFVYKFLPETTGKSLQEIQEILAGGESEIV